MIPTYDNPLTVATTVEGVRKHLPDVILVDDGSSEPGRLAVESVGNAGRAIVIRRQENGGKGAAVKTGFEAARRLCFSHVLQIDADGQHDSSDIPRFLEVARERPSSLVLGRPVFDSTQPRGRAFARKISQFWVNVETGGRVIDDPQCGFRVYPLEAAITAARASGNRMEFDQELPVRMAWRGVPVINIPTRVRYLTPKDGGVSHFRVVSDNVRISWMHTRLVFKAPWALARNAVRSRHARG